MKIKIKEENWNDEKKKKSEALELKRMFRIISAQTSSTGAVASNYFSENSNPDKSKFDNVKKK